MTIISKALRRENAHNVKQANATINIYDCEPPRAQGGHGKHISMHPRMFQSSFDARRLVQLQNPGVATPPAPTNVHCGAARKQKRRLEKNVSLLRFVYIE